MYTEAILHRLTEMVDELNQDGSTYHKQSVLRKYEDLKVVIEIIYNPYKLFYITGDAVRKYYEDIGMEDNHKAFCVDIFSLLDRLSLRLHTGNSALELCSSFIDYYRSWESTIYLILNKDLKCGIGVKTINKVWPRLIPEFNVPLAKEYKESYIKNDEVYYLSKKIDGIRCLAFIHSLDNIVLYSREGIPFDTLDVIKELLKFILPPETSNLILDGEISIQGQEDNFSAIIREIRKKNHTIQNPVYNLFDCYTIEEFMNSKESKRTLEDHFLGMILLSMGDYIKILKQVRYKGSRIKSMNIEIPEGWEGFILRKNARTKFKRSTDIMKIKKFKDAEYEVINIEDSMKYIEGDLRPCIGSLTIHHKGYLVSVGSGLSDQQRLDWYEDPSLILNKTITVKYFAESIDKNGSISLRFPTLKAVLN